MSDMKDEYDFTDAERGKFYRKNAELVPPVHLDAEILKELSVRAKAHGLSASEMANQILRRALRRKAS